MKFEDYDNFYDKVIFSYIKELLDFDSECDALTLNDKAHKKIYYYYKKKNRNKKCVYV